MVADEGQQIDELLLDPLQLLREARHGLGQLADAVTLEARVVRHHLACPRARRHERLRERGARISGAVGKPLVVHQAAAALFRVAAELDGHVLPRPATVPPRDREAHGLEIEKCERRRELDQRPGERRLDHHPARGHRSHLALVDDGQLEVRRQVVDRCVAVRLVLQRLLALDPVQAADVMVRQLRPAALEERAIVRPGAVVADRDLGEWSLEHALLGRELVGEAQQHSLDRRRNVLAREQVAQIGIAALRVQVHHRGSLDR